MLAVWSGPVHLHLGGVTFLDCAGRDVLVELHATARLAPSMVASRPVRRLMELAGVSDLFDPHPHEETR